MKRKLTDEEKKIYSRQLIKLKQDQEIIEGEVTRLNFNNDFLLQHNFKKMKLNIKRELKEQTTNLEQITSTINEMEKHLKEGVEIKREVKNGSNKK